jgi:hypothetical protein
MLFDMCLRSANTKYSLQDEMTWKAEKMIEYQCFDINQEWHETVKGNVALICLG